MAINTAGQTRTGNSAPADAPKSKVGKIVTDATSITAADYLLVEVGFTPKYVSFVNLTALIQVEWYEGMTADTCLKTTGSTGAVTLETTNKGITICDSDGTANASGRYFTVSQNATLGVVTASDTMHFVALG